MSVFFSRHDFITGFRTLIFLGLLLPASLLAGMAGASAKPAVMDVKTAFEKAKAGEILLVDIRDPSEWRETGIGKYAVPISIHRKGFLEKLNALRKTHPGKPVGLICATGSRSAQVATALPRYGVKDVIDLRPGMVAPRGWLHSGLPVVKWHPKQTGRK